MTLHRRSHQTAPARCTVSPVDSAGKINIVRQLLTHAYQPFMRSVPRMKYRCSCCGVRFFNSSCDKYRFWLFPALRCRYHWQTFPASGRGAQCVSQRHRNAVRSSPVEAAALHTRYSPERRRGDPRAEGNGVPHGKMPSDSWQRIDKRLPLTAVLIRFQQVQ